MLTETAIDNLNKLIVLIMLGLGLLIHGYCTIDIYIYSFIKLCSAIGIISK
jgi:hypothetical protein